MNEIVKRVKNELKKPDTKIVLLILAVGFFLRIYKFPELFLYSHDNDLAGWFVRDVVEERHLRLIGQETSTQGVFIGPLYYYLLIPFYLLTGMDPIGGGILITILGLFSILSIIFVFTRVFDKRVGIIAGLIYSVSFYTVFNDREVVPTMPVLAWSVWYLYSLNLVQKKKYSQGLLVAGILFGLVWHLNFALILVSPLIVFAIYQSKAIPKAKDFRKGALAMLVLSLPLILFEIRHNFVQLKAVVKALTTNQHDIISGWDKFVRVIHLASKNTTSLFMSSPELFKYEHFMLAVVLVFIYLLMKKQISSQMQTLMIFWTILYIGFFSFYSKILSEYYLNGLLIVPLAVVSIFLSKLLKNTKTRYLGYLILSIFLIHNLLRILTINVNKSGYVYKKELIEEIKNDALAHDYPCISISYITDPGYDLGYRYFFWLEDMHVNRPNSGSPVYTIVYPLKPIFPEDKSFGAIGLIYPDYSLYTKELVEESCSGQNSNVTDPMFGFTN